MASTATRQFARVALRASARRSFVPAPRQAVRTNSSWSSSGRRFYSSSTPPPPPPPPPAGGGGSSAALWIAAVLAAAGGGGYYYASSNGLLDGIAAAKGLAQPFVPTQADYQAVYDEIAGRLEEDDGYDDGSYGPVVLRLAWHASGTYDKETGTGGSNGATMRFAPESQHGANAGLKAARDFLQPVKEKFPWITYSDLWILGGCCAIQEMYGPTIPFRPGRADGDVAACTPDGRLPDASQGQRHLRDIFYRMGFNDQEIVALSGAHALGRCHADRSGFSGPWTFSPTMLTNEYFNLLLSEKWQWKKWGGPKQYEDKKTMSIMMLPTDMALVQDRAMKQWVEKYAKDNDLFFSDFQAVILKLFELGVPFAEGSEDQRITFKGTA